MGEKQYFFDILSPSQFFDSIQRSFERLCSGNGKSTEDLLFIIVGLTHLREWIAPGFNRVCQRQEPKNEAECFHNEIFDLEEFRIIHDLCNHSKHMQRVKEMVVIHEPTCVDEWTEVDAVRNVDAGPPTHYFVDGRDVLDVARILIDYYKVQWFAREAHQ